MDWRIVGNFGIANARNILKALIRFSVMDLTQNCSYKQRFISEQFEQ